MENKNNKILLILTIILGTLVIILGGYVTYDKIIKKEEINDNNNSTNSISNNIILKLDNNKNWVYDANYNLPTDEESYYGTIMHDKLIKASDLIVPYINIDSEDAKKTNNEIYKLYEDLINEFNSNLKDKIAYKIVTYKTYLNSNILSIVITTERAGTSIPVYDYYTYNFNLNNGKLLSYEELYKNLGYTDDFIENKISQSIDKTLKEEYSFEEEIHKNNTINKYKESFKNNTINFYINDDKKLNIIVELDIPVQGPNYKTITLE